MKVLEIAECKRLASQLTNARPRPQYRRLAADFGISVQEVEAINRCFKKGYPLDDYLIVDNPGYVPNSTKRLKLPMSKWGKC